MTKNLNNILFLSSLMMGSIISISSNSWLGVWMGLEMNLLSFMPVMVNNKNMLMNESSIKYFIVQAIASTMLLFSIMIILMKTQMNWEKNLLPTMMISSSLIIKMGAAPFHMWFPEVMSKLSWSNCLLLMTWQKIAPMMVMSYCMKMSLFMCLIILTSTFIGAIGGINQTSMRQLLAYSSINHLGWMIGSMMISETMWELYFLTYSVMSIILVIFFNEMNLFHVNQITMSKNIKSETKIILFITLLSMGGLPPLLGFLPKWLVMQSMVEMGLTSLITAMTMLTMITLLYYMRLSFTALIFSNNDQSWSISIKSHNPKIIMSMMVMISTIGLISSASLVSIF